MRERNQSVPIFVLADHTTAEMVPTEILRIVTGYVWKLEDTPSFVAARVEEARREYLERCAAVLRLAREVRAEAVLMAHPRAQRRDSVPETPVGSAFHEFFGENTLRSDLSVSSASSARCSSIGSGRRGRSGGREDVRRGPDDVRHQRHLDREQDRVSRVRQATATWCSSIATATSRSCTRL